ncbi:hypothetical protein [Streptoalloteichus hindustanus]|uniref:Uncharacterized protein n=1 Tax=Streptoalloteichus hindustanus TaxID=2017 RepID=A0A1M5PC41_STRHI|nr:hypothetical protein [Streptoalloteichus hindustanus]SHG99285.1 hypothetical protein SAMN05444320_1183 [Streptoalloteichus hindustanus]
MNAPSHEYGETELPRRTVLTALGLAASAVVVGVLTMSALPKVRDGAPVRPGSVVPVNGAGGGARLDSDAIWSGVTSTSATTPDATPSRTPRGGRHGDDGHRGREHHRRGHDRDGHEQDGYDQDDD